MQHGARGQFALDFPSDAKEFYMDYIELCPKEVFDNPETPEDIW